MIDRSSRDGEFRVPYQTKAGLKYSVFYNKGFRHQPLPSKFDVDTLPQYVKYDKPYSLATRLKKGVCEMCAEKVDILHMHHVAKLKELTGATEWERLMMKKHRKTLAVCPNCHTLIHANSVR